MQSTEYRITILEGEKVTQAKKYHAAYDNDIKKLKSFQAKIDKMTLEIEKLKNDADAYWNNIS